MSSRKKRAPVDVPPPPPSEIATALERVYRYALSILDNGGWTNSARVLDRYGQRTNIFDETARKFCLYAACNLAAYETRFPFVWDMHFHMLDTHGAMVTDETAVERWERTPGRTFEQVERFLMRCIRGLRQYQQMEMAA